jgi:hypothetical protein
MKKVVILEIVIAMVLLLILGNLLVHYFYFKGIQKNFEQLSEEEKLRVIELINQSFEFEDYDLVFKESFFVKENKIAKIELIRQGKKETYLVNINQGYFRKIK